MHLPASLVLLKLTTVKGKYEVDPNATKAYWGSSGIAPLLTTALHEVIHFPPRLLYPRGKNPPGTH
jgi:hypothetical protein